MPTTGPISEPVLVAVQRLTDAYRQIENIKNFLYHNEIERSDVRAFELILNSNIRIAQEILEQYSDNTEFMNTPIEWSGNQITPKQINDNLRPESLQDIHHAIEARLRGTAPTDEPAHVEVLPIHQLLLNLEFFEHQVSDTSAPLPQPPIKYLAIQGGGAKGAAYPSVAMALDDNGYLDDIEVVLGASAGAITAFSLGLGLSGEQFQKLSDQLNFTDFLDGYAPAEGVAGIVMRLAISGGSPGETFHNLARYMLAEVVGDPDITFAELHELRKSRPELKDMIFKATCIDSTAVYLKNQSITFSYSDPNTRDVKIADALRASMSFPGAFIAWPVRKKNGDDVGLFSDGGILNNYPIDVCDGNDFADPRFPRIEGEDKNKILHRVNPCAVGLSLTSLENLDPRITEQGPKIAAELAPVIQKRAIKEREEKFKITLSRAQKLYKGESPALYKLGRALFSHVVGTLIKEDMAEKQNIYRNQTVQIPTVGVGTLEFDVATESPEKYAAIKEAAYGAMQNWLNSHKDEGAAYANGDPGALAPELKNLSPKHQLEILCKEFYKEQSRLSKVHKNLRDSNNVKLKYLAFHIKRLKKACSPEDILAAQTMAYEIYTREKAAILQARAHIENIIQKDIILRNIYDNLLDSDPERRERAILILKGQLSKIIPLSLEKLDGVHNLLGMLATLPIEETNEIISLMHKTYDRCLMHNRMIEIKYSFATMLNNFASPTIIDGLLESSNPSDRFLLLLRDGYDPLHVQPSTDRNAFQEVIERNNYGLFRTMINNTKLNEKQADDILRYAYEHGEPDFLNKLNEDRELCNKFKPYPLQQSYAYAAIMTGPKSSICQTISEKLWPADKPKISTAECGRLEIHRTNLQRNLDRLFEIAQSPTAPNMTEIADLTRQIGMDTVLSARKRGKSLLYTASEAGNIDLVLYLRNNEIDASVNDAGPIDCPCALLAAAKNNHSEVVVALMNSIHYVGRYKEITRQITEAFSNRIALHYLAVNGTPEAFFAVLNGGGVFSKNIDVAQDVDAQGYTALHYLIENNRIDILSNLPQIDLIFGEKNTVREMVYALKSNKPEVLNTICSQLSAASVTRIQRLVEEQFPESEALENITGVTAPKGTVSDSITGFAVDFFRAARSGARFSYAQPASAAKAVTASALSWMAYGVSTAAGGLVAASAAVVEGIKSTAHQYAKVAPERIIQLSVMEILAKQLEENYSLENIVKFIGTLLIIHKQTGENSDLHISIERTLKNIQDQLFPDIEANDDFAQLLTTSMRYVTLNHNTVYSEDLFNQVQRTTQMKPIDIREPFDQISKEATPPMEFTESLIRFEIPPIDEGSLKRLTHTFREDLRTYIAYRQIGVELEPLIPEILRRQAEPVVLRDQKSAEVVPARENFNAVPLLTELKTHLDSYWDSMGPKAWYSLSGATNLNRPAQTQILRALITQMLVRGDIRNIDKNDQEIAILVGLVKKLFNMATDPKDKNSYFYQYLENYGMTPLHKELGARYSNDVTIDGPTIDRLLNAESIGLIRAQMIKIDNTLGDPSNHKIDEVINDVKTALSASPAPQSAPRR